VLLVEFCSGVFLQVGRIGISGGFEELGELHCGVRRKRGYAFPVYDAD
jgi:hypothetical protein